MPQSPPYSNIQPKATLAASGSGPLWWFWYTSGKNLMACLGQQPKTKQSKVVGSSPYRNIHPQAVGGASGFMKLRATLEKGNMGVKGSSAICGGWW